MGHVGGEHRSTPGSLEPRRPSHAARAREQRIPKRVARITERGDDAEAGDGDRIRHGAYVTIPIMGLQRAGPRLAAVVAIAVVCGGTAPRGARADLFDDLYRRGQAQNGGLRTFTAAFTETTTSTLLTRPLTAHGTVAVERPARVALRYTDPDERLVIIDGDRMTIAWPSRGVQQTKDIGAAQRRVYKYFVDSSPAELRSHFAITAREMPDRAGYLVTMVPARKQIKEWITRLEIALDPSTLLMTAMEMTFPNGDRKRMAFSEVRPNAPIEPGVFRLRSAGR
jgi:outer membrane lipoprotein-sorting protein